MHNAMGIQQAQLTLPGGIWESSTKKAKWSWMLNSDLGSPGEEAGEHPGTEQGGPSPLVLSGGMTAGVVSSSIGPRHSM